MNKSDKIYVAGHRGLVGSAIVRRLEAEGYENIVTRTHKDLDLTRQAQVEQFFAAEKPRHVFLAAAKVGGILANDTYRAQFIYENIMIEANIIHAAYLNRAEKLLFLGSSCIYPRECPQPMKEEHLLTGPLESTNEPYAVAKIAGLKLVESYNRQYQTNFVSVMPTNLYGPGDNFDLETSHVLPAMIRRFHEAKARGKDKVVLWGDGTPRREFLHVDDMADACVTVMNKVNAGDFPGDLVNIGTGRDIAIKDLASLVAEAVGYTGQIAWDVSKPGGTPRKLLDVSRLASLGWSPGMKFSQGIRQTYQWYLDNQVRGGK